ncbi:MAG: TetR/AcrR family transcriptional regulator [Oscillospiraceae bacterium]|nr:TetR/AcrR family transcriptional regulator [Oscillospiraceae bacterium]
MSVIKTEMEKREISRMSNSESKRITKECLQVALIYLMAEKPLEKITITELVQRSGVSRTAFYRNYNTKEDILLEMSKEISDAITKSMDSKEYEENPKSWYAAIFSEVRKESRLMGMLLKTSMFDTIVERLKDIIKGEAASDVGYMYMLEASADAQISLLTEWFNHGMKESEDYMAELCLKIRAALA